MVTSPLPLQQHFLGSHFKNSNIHIIIAHNTFLCATLELGYLYLMPTPHPSYFVLLCFTLFYSILLIKKKKKILKYAPLSCCIVCNYNVWVPMKCHCNGGGDATTIKKNPPLLSIGTHHIVKNVILPFKVHVFSKQARKCTIISCCVYCTCFLLSILNIVSVS